MTTDLKHKTAAAIDFLRWLRPTGPWSLVALIPDGKDNGATFTADQQEKMRKWIEERQGKQNIYYQLNPTIKPTTTTATKANTARIEFLHVDVDPRAGEDFEEERARIKSLLMERIGEMLPATPELSAVIDSGGGYQGLFRLTPSPLLEVNGDVSKAEELECYTRQLETLFGCDHTHNVNRILRLPGTVNLPTAKKRKNGRKPALAELIDFNDNAYSLDLFKAAPRKAEATDSGTPTASRKASPRAAMGDGAASPNEWQGKWSIADATIPPTVGTAELTAWADANGKTIDDWALALVTTGDASKYEDDRSRMVMAVATHLVRAEVPNELIAGLLLDSNNAKFYEHVKEKGGRDKRRYVERQVNRAHGLVAKEDKKSAQQAKELALVGARANALAQLPPIPASGYAPFIDLDERTGRPFKSLGNVVEAMKSFDIEFRKDLFTGLRMVNCHALQEFVGAISDRAEILLRAAIRLKYGVDASAQTIHDAIAELCELSRFDSLIDHLNELPEWDGTPRLDTWLIDYCGTEDNAFTREAGAKWLTAAVVRAFEPGAKFDNMLVLLGAQDLGKSSVFRVLATGSIDLSKRDRFSDAAILKAANGREALELSGGVWIQECAELNGISKQDVDALKDFITHTFDKGRMAYARNVSDVDRRWVMGGTLNPKLGGFLQDETGNRRFWPIEVTRADFRGVYAVRNQLLAEARARHRAALDDPDRTHRETLLVLSPEARTLAQVAQEKQRVVDTSFTETLEVDLAEHIVFCDPAGPKGERSKANGLSGKYIVKADDVYAALNLNNLARTGATSHKVATAMRSLGWERHGKKVRLAKGEKQYHVYVWAGKCECSKPGECEKDQCAAIPPELRGEDFDDSPF